MNARKVRNVLVRKKNDVIEFLEALIEDEPRVRDAVRAACSDTPVLKSVVPATTPAKPVSLPLDLPYWREWLRQVRQDRDLAGVLLGDDPQGDDALARLIARGSNWAILQEAWELVAKRCSALPRMTTKTEFMILDSCLVAHNLIWQDKKAVQIVATAGERYDGKLHRRTGMTGDIIRNMLLPGIQNAGGELALKPLVETE